MATLTRKKITRQVFDKQFGNWANFQIFEDYKDK